ncbi:MAG: hypothetical protein WBL25_10680 [Anaerolineales bacterium]
MEDVQGCKFPEAAAAGVGPQAAKDIPKTHTIIIPTFHIGMVFTIRSPRAKTNGRPSSL